MGFPLNENFFLSTTLECLSGLSGEGDPVGAGAIVVDGSGGRYGEGRGGGEVDGTGR